MTPPPPLWTAWTLAALFVAAIAIPGLVLLVHGPRNEIHVEESRRLAPIPTLPASLEDARKLPRHINAFLDDHFGFRPLLLRAHAHLLYYVLRASPSPKVLLGRDGFLFLKGQPDVDGDPITDFRGTLPLIPYQLERWRWQFEEQRIWLRQFGIDYVIAIIPSKASIYPENLPRHIRNHRFPPSALEQVIDHLSRTLSVPVLDLTRPMSLARENVQVYQRTDTHWTDDGGLAATEAILHALKPTHPRANLPPDSFWTREPFISTEGDLVRMIGLTGTKTEPLIRIRPAHPRATVTPLSDHPLTDISATLDDPDKLSVLLFHDSFGHYLKPILPDLFRAIRFRWTNLGLEPHLVAEHQPDVVITLMAERRLRLGQRYPVEIQQAGAGYLFGVSETVLGHWDGTRLDHALDALDSGVTLAPGQRGLLIDAPHPVPHLQLPPIHGADRNIPVLRIDFDADYAGDLTLVWETRDPASWPGHHAPLLRAPVRQGFNRIYFPLIDPEMTGASYLQFGPRGGRGELLELEIRSRPRDEPLPLPPLSVADATI
ncbi:MAG TPA: hypothetical protein PKE55_03025 [Kiritimatiellia bacterium]|nr:hypothetical protein [Kiritimatiellia bacterium]